MHYRARILAGTALALVMLAGHAQASPQTGLKHQQGSEPERTHLLFAQAEEEPSEEELLRRRLEEEAQRAQDAIEEEQERAVEPVPDAPPPAQEAPPPAAQPPAQVAPPSTGQDAAPQPPAGQTPPVDGAAEPVPEAPTPPAQDAPPPPSEEPPATQPPAAQPTPPDSGTEPIPGAPTPPAQDAQPPATQPPATQPPSAQPPAAQPPAGQNPPVDGGAAEPIPGAPPPPAQGAQPPATQPPATQPPSAQPTPPDSGTEPIPGAPTPPAQGAQPPATQPPATQPPATQPPAAQPPAVEGGVEPVGNEAPLLDSAKEAPEQGQPAEGETPVAPPAEAGPPPATDAEAQQLEQPVEVQSLRAEEGRRIERRQEPRERLEGMDVLREIGDRILFQFGGQTFVESDDRGRIGRGAEDVYYEELPRGRTRETVVRANGVQVVTVYDRFGDVIQRSRITPDGREHILVYADGRREREREDRRQWRDPGRDLPPLRLTIPADEYILDAGRVRDDDAYYEFLDQPPVEPVRRLYSVDEVRYSARVRDSVRRVELDTITFDFGSASIAEDAIPRLDGVATAMERLLERNPGEVFLIEGHTDAVGSDEANLALSDRRAEGVAIALTNVFGIPPENLVTQGYGEAYLKIRTQEPERENRRVAIRRITPLVAPVASAQ